MKPLILLTNDDGIDSPGFLAMAEAARPFGELLAAAPARQQTSMGRAFPRTEGLGKIDPIELHLEDGSSLTAYRIEGSPSYAAAHGILELADRRPALCISGINYGENLGTNLTSSGTVGAILEADTHGVPGIAFSVQAPIEVQRSSQYARMDWEMPKKIVSFWVEKVLREGMEYQASMLNINIPSQVSSVLEYSYTRQSSQNYFDFLKPPKRSLTEPYEIPSVINYNGETLEKDSDIYAVCEKGIVSVTPMVHDLTVKGF